MHIGTYVPIKQSQAGTLFSYIIDHTEVLLQTYDFDLDLRFRGNPGRPASPDLAPRSHQYLY